MENQNPWVPPLWEHSLTTLLGHDPTSDPGIALRQWVHFQGVHNILDLLSWDQEELKAVPAQKVYSLDDYGQGLYLSTNQIKQIYGPITYMKHVFGAYNSDIDPRDDPFHPFTPVSIPRVEAVLANLVVVSPSNCKFSFISNFLFDC